MECSSCNVALSADARFCANCGAAVSRDAVEPADPLRELLKVALGRQYEILHLLGRGGMGAVYLAKETSLDREVAIKVLPSHQQTTEESRERFRREARIAAKLSHPNIVPLLTFGDVDGTLYFVMGYVKGESLAAKLRREGRLDIETARRILTELSDALGYAHSLGIVHRDIKPDNVLIEEGTGRAILTDFGVAKPLAGGETLTVQGSLVGTPHYMSPEQASGRTDIDHRSDLYSLGVLGYAMLAGRLPFEGKTAGDVLVQHITVEAPPLKTLAPDVPAELSIALQRCLQKQPEKRWFAASDFRASLNPAEEEMPNDVADLREAAGGMLIAPIFALYASTWFVVDGRDPERTLAVLWISLLAVIMPILIGGLKWRSLRKKGYEHRRIGREMLRQPKRWIGWYPRRFRAKGDVYDRLPVDLRRARKALSMFIVSTFVFIIPFWLGVGAMVNRPDFDNAEFPKWVLAVIAAGLAPLISGAFYQYRWRRKMKAAGLYDPEIDRRINSISTAPDAFWSKPEVVRLLAPAEQAPRRVASVPESPNDLVTAIASIVSALDFPARELGERALHAARKLASSLDDLDREITALAVSVDPAERDRLTTRLRALPDADTARFDVRTMLQQQLELLGKIESRIDDVKQQRAKRGELLKTLWLQVSALSAVEGAAERSDTIERVGALCDQISTHVAQEGEANRAAARAAEQAATLMR